VIGGRLFELSLELLIHRVNVIFELLSCVLLVLLSDGAKQLFVKVFVRITDFDSYFAHQL